MTDVVDLIERDHRDVEDLFSKFAATHELAVARQLCDELERHMRAEEIVVYPVVARELPNGALMAGEGEDEHRDARALVDAIRAAGDESRHLLRLVEELQLAIELHVDVEESEVLPQVRAVLEPACVEALGRAFLIAKGRARPTMAEG